MEEEVVECVVNFDGAIINVAVCVLCTAVRWFCYVLQSGCVDIVPAVRCMLCTCSQGVLILYLQVRCMLLYLQ